MSVSRSGRRGEYLLGLAEFDQVAEIHEGGVVRDACGLLHIVRDDDDRVVGLQFVDQFLDLRCRDRIERRGGFVEQDDFGLHRNGACDAQTLLLAAGKAQSAGVELVLHLGPERRPLQRLLDAIVHLGLGDLFIEADAEGDVFVDRHREGGRFLEDHADPCPEQVEILRTVEDVLPVEQHIAFRPLIGIEVVDAVEDAQQSRLSAAGRADERSDLALAQRQCDAFQRQRLAVIEAEISRLHLRRGFVGIHGGTTSENCVGLSEIIHRDAPILDSMRATILRTRMATVMISAPPQARRCQSS
jgi:hypothetical protein